MRVPFAKKAALPSDATPQERFNKALENKDYSNKACIRSCTPKTVILTGVETGEENSWLPNRRTRDWKTLFASKSREPEHYHDRSGERPAYATIGITWVEQGLWNGRKAHFLRLRVEHHQGAAPHLQRVELDVRAWKAGDALKSIADQSHKPLSSLVPSAALDLSATAPEIALYGPRAAVGRPHGTPVDCFWDGHFQPGDRWKYFAELVTPQQRAHIRPTQDNIWSMLHVVSYGDYKVSESAHDFTIGMVVLSDGAPFDLTAYSASHYVGGSPVYQYLWTPYAPAKINGSMRILPKGNKPIKVDFGSPEMRLRWKELVDWSTPYDTVGLSHFARPFTEGLDMVRKSAGMRRQ